ncbi:MAG: DUF86 domain-containing protein [Anaerolineae bacterium]|nr:DUF86 domain-containing protein [Anaerolineae bacterium]
MSRHEPMVRVHYMLDHAREAVEMVHHRSRVDLDMDRMLNLALVRLMEIVGEAAVRMPEAFRSRYPQIPWRDVADLRNRLIHGYDTVDFDILWTIIQEDLPPLIEQLETILEQQN